MATTPRRTKKDDLERWYRGKDIPMRLIRRFARDVAERFHPDRIILFGSYAYGTPHEDSDVDVLVVMPYRNQLNTAFKIHSTILPPFPLDVIVRTPKEIRWRLQEGESFLTEIVSKGKVLYEIGRQPVTDSRGHKEPSSPSGVQCDGRGGRPRRGPRRGRP
jgi:predicted nucleotidyltransferase